MHRATGLRAMLFLAVYVVGWLPVLVAYAYTVAHGHITWRIDVALGVCGSLHSWWVPLTYDILSRRFRLCKRASSYAQAERRASDGHGSPRRSDISPRGSSIVTTSPRPYIPRSPKPRMSTPPPPMSSRTPTPPPRSAYVFRVTAPSFVVEPMTPVVLSSPMSTSRISTLQLPSTTRSPHANEHFLRVDG